MTRRKQLILAAFVLLKLIALLILMEATGLDLWLQKAFYDFHTKTWLVDRDNAALDWIFYTGPKSVIIAVGALLGLAAIASLVSEKLAPYRSALWFAVAVMALTTSGTSFTKAVTHVHCPRELQEFGGKAVYNPITEKAVGDIKPQAPDVKKGRCFPAGHASGGFSLMAFALLLPPSRRKWAYGAGLFMGWWMGGYQILNGAHFLSHNITTMLWAVFVTLIMSYMQQTLRQRNSA